MDSLQDTLTYKLSSTRIGMLIGAGGVMLAVSSLLDLNMRAKLILAGGMLLVALVLVLFLFIMKMRAKHKFAAGDEAIQDEMRKRPRKMNNPEALAKVADLSRRFERGVSLYKQATGQRLSECPWYLFTGTPGSGKTEAIRHCGIGMPEGLHEEQQGAGGTVNMDWWFTDDAIILDTAGRYLTDVDSTSEWEEFLKLLNRARPDAPINGMLVALPADSLLKDSSDEVQRKGTEIAKFLDRVRRTLGVRFPVFIVVTKSDLIPGFREFFSHMSDSELQAQIVGWSKPGDLDDAFEPDDVEEYLQTLRDTLIRRRMGLLVDPIHTEDVSGRRLDQVDSLYMFPDGLLGIAPRLKRYLQMVFVKSKFNQNPLFLRGIYFTQAFEEGAALDEALARIRGIPLEQLEAEGRGWRRDRALFLRDLFERKVFKENGLVTRASNTAQLKRKRAMTMLAAGFAAIALMGAFVYYSYKELGSKISNESAFWSDVKSTQTNEAGSLDLIKPGPIGAVSSLNFKGNKPTQIGKHYSVVPASFFGGEKVGDLASITSDVEIPRLFKPLLALATYKSSNFNEDRRHAFQVLFNLHVLVPLIRDVCDKITISDPSADSSADSAWTKDSVNVRALIELLKLESVYNGTASAESVKLAPLYQYLKPDPMPDTSTIDNLQATFESIYGKDGLPQSQYKLTLRQSLDSIHSNLDQGASGGTDSCIKYWKHQCVSSDDIVQAAAAINKFQDWRDKIESSNYFFNDTGTITQPRTLLEYEHKRGLWTLWWTQVSTARDNLDAFLKHYPTDDRHSLKKRDRLALKENYNLQVQRQFDGARDVFDACNRQIFPSAGTLADPLKGIRERLLKESSTLPHDPEESGLLANAEACDKWGTSYPGKDKKSRLRLTYEIVSDLCKQATELLPANLNDAAAADQISKADECSVVEKETSEQIADSPAADSTMKALANLYSSLIAPAAAYVKLKNDLDQFPKTANEFETAVGGASQADDSVQQTAITLPLTIKPDLTFDHDFAPDAFATEIGKWYEIKDQIDPSTRGGTTRSSAVQFSLVSNLKQDCRNRQVQIEDAVKDYYKYWTTTLDNDLLPTAQSAQLDSWDKVTRQIGLNFRVEDVNQSLVAVYSEQLAALDKTFRGSVSYAKAKANLNRLKGICNAPEGGFSKEESCILHWRKLADDNNDPIQAQLVILGMRPDDFYTQYLSVEAVPYWNAISTMILKTLAKEVKDSTQKHLDSFREACRRYPVDASQNPAVGIANAAEAGRILELLPTNISDTVFAPDSIGAGRDTKRGDSFDTPLHELRVSTLNAREKRQKDILNSLINSNGEVKIKFLQRDGKAKADKQGQFMGKLEEPDLSWMYVTFREWNFDAEHPERDVATIGDPPAWKLEGIHFCGSVNPGVCNHGYPQTLPGLTVLFRKTTEETRVEHDKNNQLTNAQQFRGPWPFISMILAQRSPDSPAAIATKTGQTVWTVEVPDPAGQTSVLIQLDIPGSNYPSVADWPQ